VTQAREFADFWLRNSVHADEQFVARRNRKAVKALADKMISAAKDQGFAKDRMEAEIGDIYAYIRASIDTQNVDETARLKKDGSY
jgi:hypothetical protein